MELLIRLHFKGGLEALPENITRVEVELSRSSHYGINYNRKSFIVQAIDTKSRES